MSSYIYTDAGDIVGYTFNAENVCCDCGREIAKQGTLDAGAATSWGELGTAENILGEWALLIGLDREDETSFDSGYFPKRLYRGQDTPGERCGRCHMKLVYLNDDEFWADLERFGK